MNIYIYGLIAFILLFVFFIGLMKVNKGSDGFWPFFGAVLAALAWPFSLAMLALTFLIFGLMFVFVDIYYKAFPEEKR